jgi:D-arabinose 1-dehydrogenase-like Zn-dependent alcohol dehydrogenase
MIETSATTATGTTSSSPANMRAIVMHEFGGPEVLRLEEVPRPEPGAGEVRIHVHATFVAKTKDISTRTGKHPYSREMRLPHILGGEHAGVVDAVGVDVDGSLVGARVGVSSHLPCGVCPPCRAGRDEGCRNVGILGIHTNGAYAEYCVAPARNVHRLPDDVSFPQAAAMAANGGVGTGQLDAANVGVGDWVAIPGATGALGSVDIGLAARRGAHVIALVRDLGLADRMRSLGAEEVLDVTAEHLAEALIAATGGRGLDVVVDNLAMPELYRRYMPALATTGRVVLSGALVFEPLPVDARSLYVNTNSIIGLRTGNHAKIAKFWEVVRDGFRLPAELVETVALEDIAAAHEARTGGKSGHMVVCTV